MVTVKIIPRLNVHEVLMRKKTSLILKKRNNELRQAAATFNVHKVEELGLHISFKNTTMGKITVVSGMEFQAGCLLKFVPVCSLRHEYMPSANEIESFFERCIDTFDWHTPEKKILSAWLLDLKRKISEQYHLTFDFTDGDHIKVTADDLTSVTGTVIGFEDNSALIIRPDLFDLGNNLIVNPSEDSLQKLWKPGDLVFVIQEQIIF